jgi:hypothetical protein
MKLKQCKYCRRKLVEPCSYAAKANGCENAADGVAYADRPQNQERTEIVNKIVNTGGQS